MSQERPNWWDRNWKWFLPVSIFSLITLLAAFVVAIVLFVSSMMHSSGAYTGAVMQARSSSRVQQLLGQPIEEGFLPIGNIKVNGPSGHANLAIPLHGPKGKATLFVEANKAAGQWKFKTLVVKLRDTGERVDITGTEESGNALESVQ